MRSSSSKGAHDESVYQVLQSIRAVAENRIAEVDRLVEAYLTDRDGLEAVGFDDLVARIKAGTVIVLDVRPMNEFEAGHIAGAVSIPHDELEARLRELPRGTEVVAYCRGPYCLMADRAVKVLRSKSRKARRLAGGLPEWRAAGLPVSSGS